MVDCPVCSGRGLDPTDYHKVCENCDGSGKVVAGEEPKEKRGPGRPPKLAE